MEDSFWKCTYEENLQKAEDEMVRLSGLEKDEFNSYSVALDEEGLYLWTYEIGRRGEGKPTIVLVHGYGGSGIIFYRLYAELSRRYHVVMVDLMGFGRSARPEFNAKTPEDAEDFFILPFEEWRQKMDLNEMVIVCHSFGGYICGRYAIRYPEHVKKVVFLSSLGIDKKPEDGDQAVKNLISKQPLLPKLVLKLYKFLPFKSITPFMPLRALGRVGSPLFVKYFIKKKMSGIPKDHFKAAYRYLYQIFCRSGSGEHALHVMFEHGLLTDNSIIDHIDFLKEQGIEVSFYYGSRDWMNTDFNEKKVSEILLDRGEKVFIIDNSDHHLYFDNPDDLIDSLNIDLLSIIPEAQVDEEHIIQAPMPEYNSDGKLQPHY